jgi:hypothetical protein
MIPDFSGRTGPGLDQLGARTEEEDLAMVGRKLKKRPQEYFKMFYADTATFGSLPALRCGLDFFGADQVLFASDTPFDPEKGPTCHSLRRGRRDVRCRPAQIYEGNARRLMRLKLASSWIPRVRFRGLFRVRILAVLQVRVFQTGREIPRPSD